MTKEQKAFADHISILSKEQQDEYLDIIRKNNQGILAKEFMEENMPLSSISEEKDAGKTSVNIMYSLLKKAIVL